MRVYLPETEYEWYKVAVNCQEYAGKNKKKWILSRFEQLHPFFNQNSLWGYTVRKENNDLVLYGAVSDSYVLPPGKKSLDAVRFYVRNNENGISFPLFVGKKRRQRQHTLVSIFCCLCLLAASVGIGLYKNRQAVNNTIAAVEVPQDTVQGVSSLDVVQQVFSTFDEYLQAAKLEGGFLKSVEFIFEPSIQVGFEVKNLPVTDFAQLCRTITWLQTPRIPEVSYVQNKPHYHATVSSTQFLQPSLKNAAIPQDSLLFLEKLIKNETGVLQTVMFEGDASGISVSCQIPLTQVNSFFTQLFFYLQENALDFKGCKLGLADEKHLFFTASLMSSLNTATSAIDYTNFNITPLFVPQKIALKAHVAKRVIDKGSGQKLGEVRQPDGTLSCFYKQADGKIVLISEVLR